MGSINSWTYGTAHFDGGPKRTATNHYTTLHLIDCSLRQNQIILSRYGERTSLLIASNRHSGKSFGQSRLMIHSFILHDGVQGVKPLRVIHKGLGNRLCGLGGYFRRSGLVSAALVLLETGDGILHNLQNALVIGLVGGKGGKVTRVLEFGVFLQEILFFRKVFGEFP